MPYLVHKWCAAPERPVLPTTEDKAPPRLSPKTSKKSITSTRARGDSSGDGPGLPSSSCLGPTPGESVNWVERMQSFPTEGRPQHVMISTNMGTTSCAEALRRARTSSDSHKHDGAEEVANGGILVVTEVWREIVQDPNYRPDVFGTSPLTEVLGSQPYREEDAVSIFQLEV